MTSNISGMPGDQAIRHNRSEAILYMTYKICQQMFGIRMNINYGIALPGHFIYSSDLMLICHCLLMYCKISFS
jgi:hypothetical protein